MQAFNPMAFLNMGSATSFIDPTALTGMQEAGSFAQLALRSPELTAGMLAAQGVPPPPAPTQNVGALVNGTNTKKEPSAIENFATALGKLEPEPPQQPMAAPGVVSPNAGRGQVDGANIMRMMQLMQPGGMAARIPSLGALISGR